MSLNYKDMIALSMTIDPRGYVAGGRSIINTTSQMGRSFIYAQTQTDQFTDKMLKSNKVISDSEMIQKKATSELVRYASAASAAGVASYFMFNKIKGAVREASTFQKSLLDINVAMGNVGDNFSTQRSNALVKNIKNVQSNIYNLNEAAQAYFIVSSAGLQGTNRMGKDITQLGVHYAKLYHTLSRGRVSLEQAANFIPELIAKTGASMEIQFNNGQTQMERYLDMMGKAEVITKLKMENMRDIIDSTGASWRNLGVSFAAGLAMVGTQMTAGQSARTAGQSAKALFNKFQTDIALLGSQAMLNDPTDKLVKDLDKLNGRVLKYQDDIAKAYGGTAQFQAVVNGILTGKIDAKSETNRLIQMHQSGKISAKAFNQMAEYYKGLNALDGNSLKGTRQQRRLLLGLSMLYGDGGDYTNPENIAKGRETYEKMITEVKAGNMSVNQLLKELGTKLEAIKEQGGSQGIHKFMLASKLLFSETTSHTAFLNTLNARAVANQDVYLTDKYTGERVKSIEGLSFRDRERYQKMIAEGLAKETAKGILLYREGQRLRGADALLYTEYATRDSQNLAAKTFEANMKLFNNRLKTINADLKTVSANIGEGFLAPISGATSVIQGFTSSLSLLTNNSKGLSSLLGSFAGSIVTVGTVMATVMGVKALGRLGGGSANFLGLPTKSGMLKSETAISDIEKSLAEANIAKDSFNKKMSGIAKSYDNIEKRVKERAEKEAVALRDKINLTKQENTIHKQAIREQINSLSLAQRNKLKAFSKNTGFKPSDMYGNIDSLARQKFGDPKANARLRALNSARLEVMDSEFNALLEKQKSDRLAFKQDLKNAKVATELRTEKLAELRRAQRIQRESLVSKHGVSVSDAMYYRGREGKILDKVSKNVSQQEVNEWKANLKVQRANYSRIRNFEKSKIESLRKELKTTDILNKQRQDTIRAEIRARQASLKSVKTNYLNKVGVTQRDIRAYTSGGALQPFDKNISQLEIQRQNALTNHRINYASQSPIISSFRELNKAIPKTTKGFKGLDARIKNFGIAFKTSGGVGGAFNRGYYRMMGSPAAMMTTMGSIALATWGLSQMKEHNMFGMQNILGDSRSGRVNFLEGWLNRGKTRSKHLSGGSVTWDDLLPMISNKDQFEKWKSRISGTRGTYTDLISKRGDRSAALQVLVDDAARRGEFTEGDVNSLWTREATRLLRNIDKFTGSGYTLKDEDGKYKISDSDIITQARNAGFNAHTIALLQGNTSGFRSDLDRLKGSDAAGVDDFNKGYTSIQAELQRLAKMEQDPWGYNLYKWFTTQGNKYLGAIAAGVGFGAIPGQLFGNAGLGALIAGVGALLSMNVMTLLDPKALKEDKGAAIGSIVAGTSMAGIVGTVVKKVGGKAFPAAMMGYIAGDIATKVLLDTYSNFSNKRDATDDLLSNLFDKFYTEPVVSYGDTSSALEYVYDNKIVNAQPSRIEFAYGEKFFKEYLNPLLQELGVDSIYNTKGFASHDSAVMAGRQILAIATDRYAKVSAQDKVVNPDLMREILDSVKTDFITNIKLGGVSKEDQERILGGGIDTNPHDQLITNDFTEKFIISQKDLTNAQLESVHATEALTKQLKDTEDVWFFDINQGFYDSRSYKPGDKHIKNEPDSGDGWEQGKSGLANKFSLELTDEAKKLFNVKTSSDKLEGDLVIIPTDPSQVGRKGLSTSSHRR